MHHSAIICASQRRAASEPFYDIDRRNGAAVEVFYADRVLAKSFGTCPGGWWTFDDSAVHDSRDLGWSQSELSFGVDLTQRAIHKLEQGETEPRRTTVRAIEEVWREQGIEFEDLTDGGFRAPVRAPVLERPSTLPSHRRRNARRQLGVTARRYRARAGNHSLFRRVVPSTRMPGLPPCGCARHFRGLAMIAGRRRIARAPVPAYTGAITPIRCSP